MCNAFLLYIVATTAWEEGNLAGFLAQGPRITPPITPSLSLRANPLELVLDLISASWSCLCLCEVALGEVHDCFIATTAAKVALSSFCADVFYREICKSSFANVGTASLNVASNYKEPETGVVHPIDQLVDFAGIDSDLLCNEYLAHGTGQIKQLSLVWINLQITS
uniref:Poly (ADP ribose) polymerase n=1 Tax=Echinococcus granulosus TaxID=6210 RepID=A0A068X4Y6_ECHGR|nr:poly (ADP ribose) polymerase [Echinococcus granulosus]